MAGTRLDVTIAGRRLLATDRPLVMGILNATPDSFSDGGRHLAVDDAVGAAREMVRHGAAILDVGGESTRPGATPVTVAEEQARVLPVLAALHDARLDVAVSVDTRHAATAAAAAELGIHLVNDVSALADPRMPAVVREAGVGVILMHMQGTPRDMQTAPTYGDVVREVGDGLADRVGYAVAAGIPAERILVDPGLGFGKRTGGGIEDNCTLLARLPELVARGWPVVVGASRKRFIGSLSGAPVEDRLPGSLAAAVLAAWGGAAVVRVHDVAATVQALQVAAAVRAAAPA